MSNLAKGAIAGAVIGCGAFVFIHRRAIAAAINGDPMPEPPEWHKKCFKFFKDVEETIEDVAEAIEDVEEAIEKE